MFSVQINWNMVRMRRLLGELQEQLESVSYGVS